MSISACLAAIYKLPALDCGDGLASASLILEGLASSLRDILRAVAATTPRDATPPCRAGVHAGICTFDTPLAPLLHGPRAASPRNVESMSGVRSSVFSSSSAGPKGPHREPWTRSSSTTKGAVLKSVPAAHVDFKTSVPSVRHSLPAQI